MAALPDAAIRALADFRPVQRRWQALGTVQGIRLFDDFAHHPTEIAATLALARQVAGPGRVHAVVQPQLVSRVTRLVEEYAAALVRADQVWLLPLDSAGEAGDPVAAARALHEALGRHTVPVTMLADIPTGAKEVCVAVATGDVVVCMGPADARQLAWSLLDCLRALPQAPRSATRRWQALGTVQGIRLFDDFAHHPTEIAATLALARQVAGRGASDAVVNRSLSAG